MVSAFQGRIGGHTLYCEIRSFAEKQLSNSVLDERCPSGAAGTGKEAVAIDLNMTNLLYLATAPIRFR